MKYLGRMKRRPLGRSARVHDEFTLFHSDRKKIERARGARQAFGESCGIGECRRKLAGYVLARSARADPDLGGLRQSLEQRAKKIRERAIRANLVAETKRKSRNGLAQDAVSTDFDCRAVTAENVVDHALDGKGSPLDFESSSRSSLGVEKIESGENHAMQRSLQSKGHVALLRRQGTAKPAEKDLGVGKERAERRLEIAADGGNEVADQE